MRYKYGSNPGPYPYPDGTLIRYNSCETALGTIDGQHASGYHIKHCLGGATWVQHCNIHQARDADFRTWFECAKWRRA